MTVPSSRRCVPTLGSTSHTRSGGRGGGGSTSGTRRSNAARNTRGPAAPWCTDATGRSGTGCCQLADHAHARCVSPEAALASLPCKGAALPWRGRQPSAGWRQLAELMALERSCCVDWAPRYGALCPAPEHPEDVQPNLVAWHAGHGGIRQVMRKAQVGRAANFPLQQRPQHRRRQRAMNQCRAAAPAGRAPAGAQRCQRSMASSGAPCAQRAWRLPATRDHARSSGVHPACTLWGQQGLQPLAWRTTSKPRRRSSPGLQHRKHRRCRLCVPGMHISGRCV